MKTNVAIITVFAVLTIAGFTGAIKFCRPANAYQLYGSNTLKAMTSEDRTSHEIGEYTRRLVLRTNYAKFDYDAANNQPGNDFSYTNEVNVTMEQVFPGLKEKYPGAITWNEARLEKFNQTVNSMRIGYLARADQVTFTTLSNLLWTNFFPANASRAPLAPATGNIPHPFFIGK